MSRSTGLCRTWAAAADQQAAGSFRSGRRSRRARSARRRPLADAVERDVLAHDHQLPHFGSAPRWSRGNQTPAARPASPPCLAKQPVPFAGPPGVILDGLHEVRVDGHGLFLLMIGVVCCRRRRRQFRGRPGPRNGARAGRRIVRTVGDEYTAAAGNWAPARCPLRTPGGVYTGRRYDGAAAVRRQ